MAERYLAKPEGAVDETRGNRIGRTEARLLFVARLRARQRKRTEVGFDLLDILEREAALRGEFQRRGDHAMRGRHRGVALHPRRLLEHEGSAEPLGNRCGIALIRHGDRGQVPERRFDDLGIAVKPAIANMAASIPPRAELPECSAFVIVPMLRRKPPALAVAMPIACVVRTTSRP